MNEALRVHRVEFFQQRGVLREQGCQGAARTYRSWKRAGRLVAARTLTDAHVVDAVRDIAWTTKIDTGGVVLRKLSPEGLYGRRKMTAYLRRTTAPDASAGSVDRAMRTLGLSGVRRDKGVRTTIPAKDGTRAGDLLDRDFSAAAPNRTWVTDFTYVRTWAGFTYVAFIVDVYAQRIVAWHAATTKQTDLVMIPLRMALWQREREGHPTEPGELIHHSDAGSQGEIRWSSQHLVDGGVSWVVREGRTRSRFRRVDGDSGLRTGRCVRRCVRRGALIPSAQSSVRSGV